jgi:hypothetical protein
VNYEGEIADTVRVFVNRENAVTYGESLVSNEGKLFEREGLTPEQGKAVLAFLRTNEYFHYYEIIETEIN